MNRFRRKRFKHFFELMQITLSARILDVGGLPYDWVELGYKGSVICVALSPLHEGQWGDGNIIYLRQEATALPYPDESFDVAYSNSLLEHVGRDNQPKVAAEIKRVARRYWVQTPYRYFPVEPHYYGLFYHQMPRALRRLIAAYWTPLIEKRNCYLSEVDTIYLLDTQELQALFSEAEVIQEKFLGLTKSVIAVRT